MGSFSFRPSIKDSSARETPAVIKNAESGSEINCYFSNASNGYQRVYTQEQKGFAEVKLKKSDREGAVMAIISETSNNSNPKTKFQNSQDTIGSYPVVKPRSKSNTLGT